MSQTTYKIDENKQEVLLSDQDQQVMMEWEKPYMEACIDALKPNGDVLEIGFGCAYSANHIQSYNPKSHTIIECDGEVIKKLKEWAKDKPSVKIVEGRWQDVIHTLGVFDQIFMDDYPLDLNRDDNIVEYKFKNDFRLSIFIDLCMQRHMKIGSKLSAYLNGPPFILSKRIKGCSSVINTPFKLDIPSSCKYRDISQKECYIPLVTKTHRFNLYEYLRNDYIKNWTIEQLIR